MSAKANLKQAYSLYREMRMLDSLSCADDTKDSESRYLQHKVSEIEKQINREFGHQIFGICQRAYISKYHANKYTNYEWAVKRGLRNGLNETDARFFRFRFAMIRINNSFGVSNKILKELANAND